MNTETPDFSYGAARDGVDAQGRPKYRPAIKPEYAQPEDDGANFEGHVTDGGTEHGYAIYSNVVLG